MLNAHVFGDTCFDEKRNAILFMVRFDFAEPSEGSWRTFFEAKADTTEPLVIKGPADAFFVHHCPSGQFVKVTGVKVLYSYDDEQGADIRREAAAERLKLRLENVARRILDDSEAQPLTDLIGLYDTAGFAAEFAQTSSPPCACPLIGVPTIRVE